MRERSLVSLGMTAIGASSLGMTAIRGSSLGATAIPHRVSSRATRGISAIRCLSVALLVTSGITACQSRSVDGDWGSYGRTPLGDRHSPLEQITPENVTRLKVAWRYHTGDAAAGPSRGRPTALEATPVVIDGTMYLSTPLGWVIALDPVTGVQRWSHDAAVDPNGGFGDFASRGVSVWRDSAAKSDGRCALRVFVAAIDGRLIALDARDGSRCADFGTEGVVDLVRGLRNPPEEPSEYEQTSPPAIVNGLVVVGSAVADNSRIDAASGEVRAFDAERRASVDVGSGSAGSLGFRVRHLGRPARASHRSRERMVGDRGRSCPRSGVRADRQSERRLLRWRAQGR